MAYYRIISGTTSAIPFQIIDAGVPVDLTAATVALLLADKTGTTVSSPGTITTTNATEGRVTLTPANSSVFVASNGPYAARWRVTIGGLISYYPEGPRDIWEIVTN